MTTAPIVIEEEIVKVLSQPPVRLLERLSRCVQSGEPLLFDLEWVRLLGAQGLKYDGAEETAIRVLTSAVRHALVYYVRGNRRTSAPEVRVFFVNAPRPTEPLAYHIGRVVSVEGVVRSVNAKTLAKRIEYKCSGCGRTIEQEAGTKPPLCDVPTCRQRGRPLSQHRPTQITTSVTFIVEDGAGEESTRCVANDLSCSQIEVLEGRRAEVTGIVRTELKKGGEVAIWLEVVGVRRAAEADEHFDLDLMRIADDLAERVLAAANPVKFLEQLIWPRISYGEFTNKTVLATLLFGAKKMSPSGAVWRPAIVLITGEPGAGKTVLAEALLRPLGEAVKQLGRLSPRALDYLRHEKYAVLYLQELRTEEAEGMGYVRFLGGDDRGYRIAVTVRDEGGEFEAREVEIPPKLVVMTTHKVELDPQLVRRTWVLTVDDSPEATEGAKEWRAKIERQETLRQLGLMKWREDEIARAAWKVLYERIEPREVIVPPGFVEIVAKDILKTNELWERGDLQKIIDFIRLFALWWQRHLPRLDGRLIVTPEVLVEALRVLQPLLSARVKRLDQRILKAVEAAEKWLSNNEDIICCLCHSRNPAHVLKCIQCKKEFCSNCERVDARTVDVRIMEQIARELKKSPRTVRRYFKVAVKEGAAEAVTDGKRDIAFIIKRVATTEITLEQIRRKAEGEYFTFLSKYRIRTLTSTCREELAGLFKWLLRDEIHATQPEIKCQTSTSEPAVPRQLSDWKTRLIQLPDDLRPWVAKVHVGENAWSSYIECVCGTRLHSLTDLRSHIEGWHQRRLPRVRIGRDGRA